MTFSILLILSKFILFEAKSTNTQTSIHACVCVCACPLLNMNVKEVMRGMVATYMMERRPRVWRKEKLAESGKPERKMPLSTMEKLRGGM